MLLPNPMQDTGAAEVLQMAKDAPLVLMVLMSLFALILVLWLCWRARK